jgi:hypothetical protein
MALTAIEWTRMIGKMAAEEEVSTVTALLVTEDEDVAAAETEVAATDEASPLFQLNTFTSQSPSTGNNRKFGDQPLTNKSKH